MCKKVTRLDDGGARVVWCFFFSRRRRHTRSLRDWSSDVCSSDLDGAAQPGVGDIMGGKSGLRQISAGDLVLALRAGLDGFQAALNRKIDRLVITDLEMQKRMMFDRAPVAA